MGIVLRDYQEDLIERTRASMRSGKRAPLLVSPCGSGKTVMFSYLSQSINAKGKRPLILAHRDELLEQISETLHKFKLSHSFIAAGRIYDPRSPVHIGSVASVVRRLELIPTPDVIIMDEAHHAVAGSMWSKIISAFPKAVRLGVTATPSRLSGEPLSDMFDDMILGPTVSELIERGHLCRYKIYAPSTIDTSGVGNVGGDFNRRGLGAVADTPRITGDAIREYNRLAPGKRAIVFCVSVEHAKHVASQFTAAGIPSLSVDGSMDRDIRTGIVADFRRGKIQVLTSCDLISEGFDLPAIECAIMLRPTNSLALWIQQSGRALRPLPGKDYAVILDHAGNTMRHGLPDDEREWSLAGREKKKKADNGPPVKVCPKCFAAQFSGKPVCGYCGFSFPIESRKVAEVEGELSEVDIVALRRARKKEQAGAQTEDELVQLGIARGYRRPRLWARHLMMARRQRGMG